MPLARIDTRTVGHAGRCSAFLVLRNEAARLPHLLAYHRALGVDRFFVVDNGSEDGTAELLLAQPDCHVFQTRDSFAEANYGMEWLNELVRRYSIGSWCLFLDADELFTYPHAESLPLPAFCHFLDRTGSEGVFAILLDMYSRGPISDAVYAPGTDFLATCPHFDCDYRLRRKIGFGARSFADLEVVGGPRLRRFNPEFRNAGVARMTFERALRGLRRHRLGRALGLHHLGLGGAIPPDITKIPLIKAQAGRRWVSNHRSTPLRLSKATGVLLHFKFFSDFHGRASVEAVRGEHWDGGAEYIRYAALLAREPRISLYHEGSETYRSPGQLVEHGIMTSTPELDAFADGWDLSHEAPRRHGEPDWRSLPLSLAVARLAVEDDQ